MSKRPAKGVRGHLLLYDPSDPDDRHVFRVYDPADKAKFVDYRLAAEDVMIEIVGPDYLALVDDGDRALTWDAEKLRRDEPVPASDPLRWKEPPLNAVDAFATDSDADDPRTDRRQAGR